MFEIGSNHYNVANNHPLPCHAFADDRVRMNDIRLIHKSTDFCNLFYYICSILYAHTWMYVVIFFGCRRRRMILLNYVFCKCIDTRFNSRALLVWVIGITYWAISASISLGRKLLVWMIISFTSRIHEFYQNYYFLETWALGGKVLHLKPTFLVCISPVPLTAGTTTIACGTTTHNIKCAIDTRIYQLGLFLVSRTRNVIIDHGIMHDVCMR